MIDSWNATDYQKKGNFVPTLGEPLLELLNPKPGQRILDVGCGNGTLSLKILAKGAALVGVDASEDMVAAAKHNGIEAYLQDAHEMQFDSEFDGVFSNAALHWMTVNPGLVAQRIYDALKPGGIFVGEMGGKGNIAEILRCESLYLEAMGLDLDQISPKFFPSKEVYAGLLKNVGFEIEQMELFERPTVLPDGVSGWLMVFSKKVLDTIPAESVETFLNDVEACTKPVLFSSENGWQADYVRLRFVARKPD